MGYHGTAGTEMPTIWREERGGRHEEHEGKDSGMPDQGPAIRQLCNLPSHYLRIANLRKSENAMNAGSG